MKSNKGISMITLVITIISIIILLGIAYRIGSRYILESRAEERNVLISILSNSVERKQKDKYSNISGEAMYYVGYHVSKDTFENRLYDKFENKECMYEPGLWYILDANKSKELGIVEPEKYLVEDLMDEPEKIGNKYIAVANYFTGDVELLKRAEVDLDGALDGDDSDCPHNNVSIATCIEDGVCNDCGEVIHKAWGHRYAYINDSGIEVPMTEPTCTEDYKCIICGYIKEKAKGHEYTLVSDEKNGFFYNDGGHFFKCIRYEKCQSRGNFKEHNLDYGYLDSEEWIHEVRCTECDWNKIEQCITKVKSKDTQEHIRYCINCPKERAEKHSDFKYRYIDKNEHMVYCGVCNDDLYREEHIDIEKKYGECDKCGGKIDTSKPPQIEILTMQNLISGDAGVYWAKRGDKIRINLKTTVMLGGAPTIKLQNIELDKNDMIQISENPLHWTVDIDTSKYPFVDGMMNIEVSNLRSLWGVTGESKSETTDGLYVTYDPTKPIYIYVPEE